MKASKTVVYALACIRELARRSGGLVQVAEIAASQQIPAAYCQKVLFALAKAGIVWSVKGQGFRLSASPESITTLQLMQALNESASAPSSLEGSSGMKNLSESFTERINHTLAQTTVAEVLFAAR